MPEPRNLKQDRGKMKKRRGIRLCRTLNVLTTNKTGVLEYELLLLLLASEVGEGVNDDTEDEV